MNDTGMHDALLHSNVLGRYRIVRRLASGGMGAVYLGRTEGAQGFARPVVIKRVLPALMEDREIAQLFIREAQILSNLHHPSIVSVLDFGLQDDAYVMVLEYVQGYQLAEWMRFLRRTQQAMPIDLALHITMRVLEALHYAHNFRRSDGSQLKIIHRDISPSNVLLSDMGLVKLLDFGIARMSGDEGSTFKTERPRVRGKLPYLPLEMFKGEEPTERSDIYSLGVVLYEMLTGKNPFVGRDTADIYFKILNVEAPSVHGSRDDAPDDIDEVFGRALAKDPSKRYASAAEMLTALRTLRSEPEEVVAERFADRLRADYAGPILEALGLEPLAAREQAWRTPEVVEKSLRPPEFERAHEGDKTDPGQVGNNMVTVSQKVEPELLGAAVREGQSLAPTSPPPPAYGSPAPSVERGPAPPLVAPPPLAPPPPLVAPPAAALVPPRAPPPPLVAPPPSARSSNANVAAPTQSPVLSSMRRIALVVSLAAIVGAVSAAGLWVAIGNGANDESVVVIQRESNAPALAAPQPRGPAPALPSSADSPDAAIAPDANADATATEAEAPTAAEPAATSTKPTALPPPNPKRLTRAFGRRQKKIEECFAAHAKELQGQPQIAVHFRVGTRGQVLDASLSPASLGETSLGRCLIGVARGASFGPQQGEVAFHIPITAQKLQ